MATVHVRMAALPAHVRTARLVAAAVARRCGLDEARLDEVRLAVGEACSRAVDVHRRHCPQELVEMTLSDDNGSFRVDVRDRGPGAPETTGAAPQDALGVLAESADTAGALLDGGPGSRTGTDVDLVVAGVGIAVISGLVDDVTVRTGGDGTSVAMVWPAVPKARVR